VRRLLAGTLRSSCGDDCILCAIACGIALLALTVGATATGTGVSTSEGAIFAGGRSAGDGNAVGGDEIEFADQLPLCEGVCGRSGGEGDGVFGRGGGCALAGGGTDGELGRGGGDGGAVRGVDGTAGTREIGGGVGTPDGTRAIGGGVGTPDGTRAIGGGVATRAIGGGVGTPAGTRAIGPGVGTRGAVIDFARGAPAGAGTTGFFPGSVGGRDSVCDPRGDASGDAGDRNFGCGGIVCSGTGGSSGSGSAGPGAIRRSRARSRSASSPPEDFGSATRQHHCRSRLTLFAM
jgi:hypothetical protein